MDVLCNGDSTGSAKVSATGGTMPYTYTWSSGTTPTDSMTGGLAAGTVSVTVTDSIGCSASVSVMISEPSAISLSTNITDASVPFASDGQIMVIVAGGTPGYTYLWNDPGAQTASTATGLTLGWYTVTITDTNGCTDSISSFVSSVLLPGIAEANGLGNIVVSPNPNNGNFHVNLSIELDMQVSIVDLLGRVIYMGKFANTNQIEINLDQVNSGIYILVLRHESAIVTRKLMVK